MSYLEAAFDGFRNDPWSDLSVIERTLGLAADIGDHPRYASSVYRVIRDPLAVNILNHARRATALDIARSLDDETFVDALDQMEPYVPWKLDLLDQRASTYERIGHPRAAQAASELHHYLDLEPSRLENRNRCRLAALAALENEGGERW